MSIQEESQGLSKYKLAKLEGCGIFKEKRMNAGL